MTDSDQNNSNNNDSNNNQQPSGFPTVNIPQPITAKTYNHSYNPSKDTEKRQPNNT